MQQRHHYHTTDSLGFADEFNRHVFGLNPGGNEAETQGDNWTRLKILDQNERTVLSTGRQGQPLCKSIILKIACS